MTHYDFIEIGTSDFHTLIEEANETTRGLSIEPMQYYLDRLPAKPGVHKFCAAISSKPGSMKLYGVKPEYIHTSMDVCHDKLPFYVRGCNSVGDYHPTAKRLVLERGLSLEEVFSCLEVPVCDFPSLIEKFNISGCNYLKLDTEGHDCVILKHFFESWPFPLPQKILFESNILSKSEDIEEVIAIAEHRGYQSHRGEMDTLLILLT